MRQTLPPYCARAASGHASIAPATALMKPRRLMQRSPRERQDRRTPKISCLTRRLQDVGQGPNGPQWGSGRAPALHALKAGKACH